MKNRPWIQIFLFVVSVHLAWDANTEPTVSGYKLYYGKATRTYSVIVDVGKVTDYVLTGVSEDPSNFVSKVRDNGNLLMPTAPKITLENITGDHLLNFVVKKLYAPQGAMVK